MYVIQFIFLSCTHAHYNHLYIQASPFANPALSFVKLMVMTAGGPDDSIFRYENEGTGERDKLPFPAVAFFIWIIFIVIMAVLFVNFLVSFLLVASCTCELELKLKL